MNEVECTAGDPLTQTRNISNAGMPAEEEHPHALTCAEVWGGNQKVVRTVRLPSLLAWVASVPLDDAEGGGDLHYLSVCDYDALSRIALADVSGHGREVSAVTQRLHALMRENVNAWDQSDFMRELNKAFGDSGEGKYATAIILSYHRAKGHLAFSNAGHLPPLWYHAGSQNWDWMNEDLEARSRKMSGLPVGLIPGTDYRQTVVTLGQGDILVLYTDGITDAENRSGEAIGREKLLEWARQAPIDSPGATGEHLLQRLEDFRGGTRIDDETLLVLKREQESLPAVLMEVAGIYSFRRLKKALGIQKP